MTVYLDHASTTPVHPEVVEAMSSYYRSQFGNPSSADHALGWSAKRALNDSRKRIATALGVSDSGQIVFTSGATEAANMAIRGRVRHSGLTKAHIITQTTEHPSVLAGCKALELEGHEVTYLGVDDKGLVNTDELYDSLQHNTVLCAIMTVNNETGVIQNVDKLAAVVRDFGDQVVFFSDGVQALGKLPLASLGKGVDLLNISAHKINGPKGVGALVSSQRLLRDLIEPICFGGEQESGMRPGTENVAGIVGFCRAVEMCTVDLDKQNNRYQHLRQTFVSTLAKKLDGVKIIGVGGVPSIISLSIEGLPLSDLFAALPDIFISSGSACSSGVMETSRVLLAMGVGESLARSTIRISMGRGTTEDEVAMAARQIGMAAAALRT